MLIASQTGAHEPGAARTTLAELESLSPPPAGSPRPSQAVLADMRIDLALQNWAGVLALQDQINAMSRAGMGRSLRKPSMAPALAVARRIWPILPKRNRELGGMPGDCYPCLIAHAQVAELEKQPARADFWFARAMAEGPSLPFAEEEWGQALLERDQPDAAIEKFKLANKKGPHFADPLEGWGEALMAKNQSHLALAKFEEAEKYAPNWGRLHLKWGEALVYAGKQDEAKAQFARAAALDLTPPEKSELARHESCLKTSPPRPNHPPIPTAIVGWTLAGASPARKPSSAFRLRDQRHHLHEQLKQLHLDLFEKWLGVAAAAGDPGGGPGGGGGSNLGGAGGIRRRRATRRTLQRPARSGGQWPDRPGGGVARDRPPERACSRRPTPAAPPAPTPTAGATRRSSWRFRKPASRWRSSDSWLRAKLGHETSLTGEVVRTGAGVTLDGAHGHRGRGQRQGCRKPT